MTDPDHADALDNLGSIADRVRYACEHNPDGPRTDAVRAWLDAYGYATKRPYVSTIVTGYRQVRSMDDTGDLPVLTPEALAEMDAETSASATPAPLVDLPAVQDEPSTPAAALLIEDEPTPQPQLPAETPQVAPTDASAEARPGKARGTGPFYVAALACSLLSLDTAARFFHERLGIDGLMIHGVSAELAAVCGIGELTLMACGYAMRHNVRRDGRPGAAQLVALAMCIAASFMAVALSGPVAGGVRAFFGPVLALIALHLALGIEVRVRRARSTGAWARVVRELRERLLSRLGLADDSRTALARTRDRATDRAARLATAPGRVPFRRTRLARAVRASGVALDDAQKARLMRQVAAYNNLGVLMDLESESPWQ